MKFLSYPRSWENKIRDAFQQEGQSFYLLRSKSNLYEKPRETDFFKFNPEIFIVLPAVRTQLRHVFAIHRVRLELVALT